jgi:hypothetical protein
MAMASTITYYATATITVVKSLKWTSLLNASLHLPLKSVWHFAGFVMSLAYYEMANNYGCKKFIVPATGLVTKYQLSNARVIQQRNI